MKQVLETSDRPRLDVGLVPAAMRLAAIGAMLLTAFPSFATAAIVIQGTRSADFIDVSGSSEPHEIYGRAGQDTIYGSQSSDVVDGGDSSDLIRGNLGDDRLYGSGGTDTIYGDGGNDVLVGGGGADQLNGGDGRDVAVFSGEYANYQIVPKSAGQQVKDLRRIDGTDLLTGVEILEFADGFFENGAFKPRFPDNRAPLVGDDSAQCAEDGAVEIEVLANDSDPDGDAIRVYTLSPPKLGTATITPDGTVRYEPWPDRYGQETFQYTVDDGRFGRATGTVQINVLSRPDSPLARDDQSEVLPGSEVRIEVLRNDLDVDGDNLVLASVTQPHFGTARKDANVVVYRAPENWSGTDQFTYSVADGTGRSSTGKVTVTVGTSATGDGLLQLLSAAPEGSWVKVNLNHYSDVWTPAAQRPTGYNNPAKILFAWSSMAWDSNRNQLIFWGGGHANYAGNEVYRFDAKTRMWERASLPSEVYNPLGDRQYFAIDGPENAPIAAHTYDNQEFLPIVDRFITFGGAKYNCCQLWVLLDGSTPTGPYLWDPSRAGADMVGGTTGSQVEPSLFPDVIGAMMWENRNTMAVNGVGSDRPRKFVNGTTAYAELDGRDAVFVSESPAFGGRLFRYVINDIRDPGRDEWQLVGIRGRTAYTNQGAGAYCASCGLFVRTALTPTGLPTLVAWDVTAAGPANTNVNITPADASGQFKLSRYHGMDFDERRGVFALWDGGPDVWIVRPGRIDEPGTWTVQRAELNRAMPAPAKSDGDLTLSSGRTLESHGILGKWKYAPRYDVFLGVQNAVTGDVWAYKPVGWQPKL